jgi:hypothetical protein
LENDTDSLKLAMAKVPMKAAQWDTLLPLLLCDIAGNAKMEMQKRGPFAELDLVSMLKVKIALMQPTFHSIHSSKKRKVILAVLEFQLPFFPPLCHQHKVCFKAIYLTLLSGATKHSLILWTLFPMESRIPNIISACVRMFLQITPLKLLEPDLPVSKQWAFNLP